jgi:hypothetical protein
MVELNCSECGLAVGEVTEETYGYIGTSSLCDQCDEAVLEEILGG